MKRMTRLAAVGMLAAGMGWAHGGEDHAAHGKAAATVTGEVIDVTCYTDDGDRGAKHAQCARDCIGKGLPVGLLDAQGQVYIAVAAPHDSGAAILLPHVAKQVRATGKIHKRGGVKVIVIESVEAAPGGTP